MGCNLKNMDKLVEWAYRNFMEFSKAKCNVLHLNWSNAQHQYRLQDEQIESSLWGCWWMRGWTCCCSPESHSYPGLHQKQRGQQGDGILLLCFHETPSGGYIQLQRSQHRREGPEATESDQRWNNPHMRPGWDNWGVQPKEKGTGRY